MVENWLGHRRQRVTVEGSFSGWRSVPSDVKAISFRSAAPSSHDEGAGLRTLMAFATK